MRFNKSAIPKAQLTKYDYNAQTHRSLAEEPKMAELISSGSDEAAFQQRVKLLASKHFKLPAQ